MAERISREQQEAISDYSDISHLFPNTEEVTFTCYRGPRLVWANETIAEYVVPSSSHPDVSYTVHVDSEGDSACDCGWWEFKGTVCKHIRQVLA